MAQEHDVDSPTMRSAWSPSNVLLHGALVADAGLGFTLVEQAHDVGVACRRL
jgi:hypothetical protein